MTDQEMVFSSIELQNDDQEELLDAFKDILQKPVNGANLLQNIKKRITSKQITSIELQTNYEIYRRLRTKLTSRHIEIMETHDTCSLSTWSLIYAIWKESEQMEVIHMFDKNRPTLNRKHRNQENKSSEERQATSEVAEAIDPISSSADGIHNGALETTRITLINQRNR